MAAIYLSWKNLRRWQKALVVTACCVALYAAFGFLLLPRIVRYVLVEKVSPVLHRQVGVKEIRMNPFTFTADVTGFSIKEKSGDADFVAFDSFHANLELSSITRLALVVRETSLQGPRIHIRLGQDGHTNFEDLTASSNAPEPKTGEKPMIFPVVVEPFSLGNGTVVFEDQARGVKHVIDEIRFELPSFSTRQRDWETFMTPTLSFRVNGSPFNLEGQTIPFSDSLKTEFNLNMADLGLPQYWAYAAARKNLKLAKGFLNLETKLSFEQHEDKLPTFSLQGTVSGHDIELTDDGVPVLSAQKAEIVMDDISILNLQLGFRSVTLDSPFLRVVRKRDGSLNWAGYFAPERDAAATPDAAAAKETSVTADAGSAANQTVENASQAAAEANATATADQSVSNATAREKTTTALLLKAPEIHLNNGHVLFSDETVSFTKEIRDLNLTIDLDTSVNATSQASFRARTAEGEELGADASFSVFPLHVQARVEALGLEIPSYAPYYKAALPLSLVSAKSDARVGLALDSANPVPRIEDSSIEIRNLELAAADGSGSVQLARAGLDKIGLDLAARTVRTGVISVEGVTVSTQLDKDGRAALVAALNSPAAEQPKQPEGASNATPWKVDIEGAALKDLALRTAGKDGGTPVRIDALKVGPVSVDTGGASVNIGPVDLALAVELILQANGDINLAALFSPQPGTAKPASKETPSPWKVAVEQFSLSSSKVSFTDQTLAKPSRVDVDQISFQTRGLSTDLTKSLPLTLACRVEESGTLKATGDIVPSTLTTKGSVTLARIPLSVASPYVADLATVEIPSGRLGGKFDWRMGGKGQDRISGSLQADGFRLTEGRSKAEILGFKSLDVRQLALQLEPLTVNIGAVELVEPRGGFVIDDKGRTTLDRVAAAPKKTAAKKPAANAKSGKSDGLKDLRIETVTLKQGRFSFADRSLSPQFESVIAPVDLTVKNISLDPSQRADLDLSAVIDGSAPITATGWVSPMKDPVEANSTITLRNLDLVALSPYSSKFIAYPVARGQLDWDMSVNTNGSTLAMRNAIKARKLELGDKVESPDAADVPVKLGLALLRDMSGDIAISLPVNGDLNDPKFNIGGIVLQAFMGLIIKAVASPFTLLASLVPDGGGEDLGKLVFPPGLSSPAPDTSRSIQSLADVLKQRPGLKVSLSGHADAAADRKAIEEAQFLRKLQAVKYDEMSRKEREKTALEQVVIPEEEYGDILWEAYKNEPVEKKKNVLGIHVDVPREEQEAKLRELIKVTDDDLVRLAGGRADFVKNQLIQLGVEAGRVFLGQTGPKALSGTHDVTVDIQR